MHQLTRGCAAWPLPHSRRNAARRCARTSTRSQLREIAENLIDKVHDRGRMDIIADFAAPLPAIVTAEMLGVPIEDHVNLKKWSADFAEMLGNFQHNPDRVSRVLESTNNLVT